MPANYQFVRGNVLDRLPFNDHTFDFVHQRLVLSPAIPVARWTDEISELLRVTRPGGWLELAEVGVEVNPLGPVTSQFFEWGISASESRGLDPRQVPFIGRYVPGNNRILAKHYDVPMGQWAERIGLMMQMNLMNAFGGLKALYCERGATEDEFNDLLNRLPEEWSSWRPHIRFFVWCIQKAQ